ncbi:MAG: hypothetical protein M1409_08480 [Actinobacteria bacterium]|nr:hypothetical protein [Actinomycetota bacterium]
MEIVRKLAARVAEIAALPIQEKKRVLWRKLNGLKPERPMVMIDQVCWNEMNIDDELTIRCTDSDCRGYEEYLRQTLFRWKYFPVDMVIEPFVNVPMAIENTGFGISVQENTAVTDLNNPVIAHKFINQFQTEEDFLQKIHTPQVRHNSTETARRLILAHELFDCFSTVENQFDPIHVRNDLLATLRICEKYNCPLEIILKDISTVRYQPERLSQWAKVAMEVVGVK